MTSKHKPDARTKVRRALRAGKPISVWRGWRREQIGGEPGHPSAVPHHDNVMRRNPREPDADPPPAPRGKP